MQTCAAIHLKHRPSWRLSSSRSRNIFSRNFFPKFFTKVGGGDEARRIAANVAKLAGPAAEGSPLERPAPRRRSAAHASFRAGRYPHRPPVCQYARGDRRAFQRGPLMLIWRAQGRGDVDARIERRLTRICFGHFEACPAVFHSLEAWVYWYGDTWREFPSYEVIWNAGILRASKFDETISAWPALPEHAFATYPKARRRYEQVRRRAAAKAATNK
jgi:hypothetical protein